MPTLTDAYLCDGNTVGSPCQRVAAQIAVTTVCGGHCSGHVWPCTQSGGSLSLSVCARWGVGVATFWQLPVGSWLLGASFGMWNLWQLDTRCMSSNGQLSVSLSAQGGEQE